MCPNRILVMVMSLVGKPLPTISDWWKLPLLDCISDYSYVSPLERATDIDKTIKNPRKKKQCLLNFSRLIFPVRAHFLQWSTKLLQNTQSLWFHVTWIKATLQLSSSCFLARWPSAERNLTSSSSLLSSVYMLQLRLKATLFPFLMSFQWNTSYSEKSISLCVLVLYRVGGLEK